MAQEPRVSSTRPARCEDREEGQQPIRPYRIKVEVERLKCRQMRGAGQRRRALRPNAIAVEVELFQSMKRAGSGQDGRARVAQGIGTQVERGDPRNVGNCEEQAEVAWTEIHPAQVEPAL